MSVCYWLLLVWLPLFWSQSDISAVSRVHPNDLVFFLGFRLSAPKNATFCERKARFVFLEVKKRICFRRGQQAQKGTECIESSLLKHIEAQTWQHDWYRLIFFELCPQDSLSTPFKNDGKMGSLLLRYPNLLVLSFGIAMLLTGEGWIPIQ